MPRLKGPALYPTLEERVLGEANLPICVRTYSAVANPEYHGNNVTLGINLAMGWEECFFTLPMTYAWTMEPVAGI